MTNLHIPYRQAILGLSLLCVAWATDPSDARKAQRAIETGKYNKSQKILKESLKKDTLNPATYYVYALLYTRPEFEGYHLNTAHTYIKKSLKQWSLLDPRESQKNEKEGFTYTQAQQLQHKIDSLSYVDTQKVGTPESYALFIKAHPLAAAHAAAIHMRDSLVLSQASDTAHSSFYKRFMMNYPESQQLEAAARLYESLRFKELHILPSLGQFEVFLKEFPQSSYRDTVALDLLKMMSLSALPKHFLEFLKRYPRSTHSIQALQLLASIDKTWHNSHYSAYYLALLPQCSDSLGAAASAAPHLLPIGGPDSYRFMDLRGTLQASMIYKDIHESYLCQGLHTPYIHLRHKDQEEDDSPSVVDELYNRAGELILSGDILEIEPLGKDFLLLRLPSGQGLWHLSAGQLIPPIYDQISYLPSGLLRLEKDQEVGLFSFLGQELIAMQYEDIQEECPFFLMYAKDGVDLALTDSLTQAKQQGDRLPLFRYDKVQIVDSTYLIAQRGTQQEVLDEHLEVLLAATSEVIESIDSYWLLSQPGAYYCLSQKTRPQASETLQQLRFNQAWIMLQRADSSYALLPRGRPHAELAIDSLSWIPFLGDSLLTGFDSLQLIGKYLAIGHINHKQLLYFPHQAPQLISQQARIYELPFPSVRSKEQAYAFYRVVTSKESYILSHKGHIASTLPYLHTPIHNRYLIVEKSPTEKGIIDNEGILQVPLIHQAISYPNEEGLIPLLHKGQVGLFHVHSGTYIPAQYQSIPTSFGQLGWKVRQNNKTGVISHQRKSIIPMLYQDLQYSGPHYYVSQRKHGFFVQSYDKKKEQKGPFLDYKCWSEKGWTLLRGEKGWGLINKDADWVIAPQYDHILPLGNEEPSLFLATRYLEDAKLYVSIYFSRQGENIYAESHPESPPYLFCPEE